MSICGTCHQIIPPTAGVACPCCGVLGANHAFTAVERLDRGDIVVLDFVKRTAARGDPEPDPLKWEEIVTLDRTTRDGTLPALVCGISLRRLFLLAKKVKP